MNATVNHRVWFAASWSRKIRLSRNDAVLLGDRARLARPGRRPAGQIGRNESAPKGLSFALGGAIGRTPMAATGTVAIPVPTASLRLTEKFPGYRWLAKLLACVFPRMARGCQASFPAAIFVLSLLRANDALAQTDKASSLVLTNTAAIRMLRPEEAALSPAVKLEGKVVFSYFPWQLLFIQDAFGGCYIAPSATTVNVPSGVWIQLEGKVGSGLNGPHIVNSKIKTIAVPPAVNASLRPQAIALSDLIRGQDDAQWVETSGVVRSVSGETSNWTIELGEAGAQVLVQCLSTNEIPVPYDWYNCVVRAQGVCTAKRDDPTANVITLYSANTDGFVVEKLSPAESFREPLREIASLPRSLADATNDHEVRVQGQVLHATGSGHVYIADATDGVHLRGKNLSDLAPGDEIEAVGFVTWREGQWELDRARAKKLRAHAPPLPLPQAGSARAKHFPSMRLIQLDARLVAWHTNSTSLFLKIFRPATRETLVAEVPEPFQAVLAQAEHDSFIRLAGLWQSRAVAEGSNVLLCRSADDFKILSHPSWWTTRRLLVALSLIVGFGLLFGAWIFTLRRQIRIQTGKIREQAQFEAALNERFRDLFEEAGDAVLILDPQGEIKDLNFAAVRILGETREYLVGKVFQSFLVESSAGHFAAHIANASANQATALRELTLRAGDEPARALEVTSCRRCDSGSGVEIQLIAHDISERKRSEADIARLNQELVETSRHAGMAEVATGVLHNVGNVLNSVNISANVIAGQVRKSKVASLSKAVALLNEHKADMGQFLASDPKGRQLPGFLTAVTDQLNSEHTALTQELHGLLQNIEHIKQIVVMQQSYAKVSGVTERLPIQEVVEDALRMSVVALARHQVEVVREFTPVPSMQLDRHKALQILVNLISNAKQAMDKRDEGRRLTLRIGWGAADRVRVEVTDNGMGIAPENLTKIFQHGFTTKRTGHGFGLHSGANAAKEMGGSLTVQSDGAGHGATFILELPVSPEQKSATSTSVAVTSSSFRQKAA